MHVLDGRAVYRALADDAVRRDQHKLVILSALFTFLALEFPLADAVLAMPCAVDELLGRSTV